MTLEPLISKIRANDTKLLAIGSCVGVVTTGIVSWRAAWKLRPIWDQKKYELSICIDDEAKKTVKKELLKETAKKIWPIPFVAGGTIAGVLGQYFIPAKRIANLTTSYGLLDTAFRELKDSQFKELGEKKAKMISENAVENKLKDEEHQKAVEEFKENVKRPDGYILAMDGYCSPNNLVWTTHNNLERAILEASSIVQRDGYITLNEFFTMLNMEQAPVGEDLGFTTDDLKRGVLDIDIHTTGLTAEDDPCIIINYTPRYIRNGTFNYMSYC